MQDHSILMDEFSGGTCWAESLGLRLAIFACMYSFGAGAVGVGIGMWSKQRYLPANRLR